ncbi:MAG: maleylacetoacetate isomerase [Endozoicomonas sp.]
MKLYSYFRSSAAYRVRIALNIKGLHCQQVPVNLLKAEQQSDDYLEKNPQGLVPALDVDEGLLTQSLAILEWLEEHYPDPAFLPRDSWEKAQVRSMAYAISCDIHPLNNLRVLKYLQSELNVSDDNKNDWYAHWISKGFTAIEQQLGDVPFCFGEHPTMADICLIPQVFNALRFNVPMEPFPKINAIYQRCNELEAFLHASPEQQPDSCPGA